MKNISEFNRFFSSKTLASTYNPTLMKCLLDIGDSEENCQEKTYQNCQGKSTDFRNQLPKSYA